VSIIPIGVPWAITVVVSIAVMVGAGYWLSR